MKATKIYYQKCFNLGNYQNEVIGIELEVQQGDKAVDVIEKARYFVNSESVIKATIEQYERYKKIVESPDEYTGKQVKEAKSFIENNQNKLDLPF